MNRKRVASETLIGKTVTVCAAKNSSLVGVVGEVIDETTHTITVGTKMMHKNAITINIEGTEFEGKKLRGTLQRIKRA